MAESSHAEFPEKFVYVCTATGFHNGNIQPMRQAPRGSIVGLVVVRALSHLDEDKWASQDVTDSIFKADRITAFGRFIGLKNDQIHIIDGRLSVFDDFSGVLKRAEEIAIDQQADILFNVTSGPVPAKLGAILGYRPADNGPRLRLLYVGMRPFTCYIITQTENGAFEQRSLPVHERQSFKSYLAAWDVEEVRSSARVANQDLHKAAGPSAERLLRALKADSGFSEDFGKLMSAAADRGAPPFEWRNERLVPFIAQQGLVAEVNGVEIHDNCLNATTSFGRAFLAGHWLESLFYCRLDREFHASNDVDVLCGIELQLRGGPQGMRRSLGDIDVGVYAGSQLFFAELKAGRAAAGINKAQQQVEAIRARIMGSGGGVWIVAPGQDPTNPTVAEATRAAAGLSQVLLSGPDAIDRASEQMSAAVRRALEEI